VGAIGADPSEGHAQFAAAGHEDVHWFIITRIALFNPSFVLVMHRLLGHRLDYRQVAAAPLR
jgi:hypothetical protein